MHILMDYYLIIIKLGVMTWKDVYIVLSIQQQKFNVCIVFYLPI